MSDAPFISRVMFLIAMVATAGGLVWPNVLGLVVIGGMAWRNDIFANRAARRVFLLCLLPLTATLAMMIFAAAMYGYAAPNRWPWNVLWAFIALQAVGSAICLIWSQGFRWFAASILFFLAWLGILGLFVSSMALTDTWL
jgi:hypothetical protein